MLGRVERTKTALNKLYHGRNGPSQSDAEPEHVGSIGELVLSREILLNNVTEDQIFARSNRAHLAEQATELFDLYLTTGNRYEEIIAAMLLSRLFGFFLPNQGEHLSIGTIPYAAVECIERQAFVSAIDILAGCVRRPEKTCEAVMRGIALAFFGRAFQLIEDQVRDCVARRVPRMFRLGTDSGYALRLPPFYEDHVELIELPVRVELSSSVGSDIFFLSMNRYEKARCINLSVDLYDETSARCAPPISVLIRPTKEKGIRLTSIDLGCSKLILDLRDMFDMQSDDLALLKAAVISSGLVPPAFKGKEADISLRAILVNFFEFSKSYRGFEVISKVSDIPRGSGLGVSTNLLAGLILGLLRFSGQHGSEPGAVSEQEKLDVATRAIYGEWIGGSGGGWQDFGGMWGGFKKILGQAADPRFDPDSPGCLLPVYETLEIPSENIERILSSLVLVNGGTGQDVGPVLRMITTQFITKDRTAWEARLRAERRHGEILAAILAGDARALGRLENEDFVDRTLISPLSNNLYHRRVASELQDRMGGDLWGYDSTGGRSGAGGIFLVNPKERHEFERAFIQVSQQAQRELAGQMHFSSSPKVYRLEVNDRGIQVRQFPGAEAADVVSQWRVSRQDDDNDGGNGSFARVEEIKRWCGFDSRGFEQLQNDYVRRKIAIQNNIRFDKDEVRQIDLGSSESLLHVMPDVDSEAYGDLYRRGVSFLKEPIAYIILNGGESTRFGTRTIRGLSPLIFWEGTYRASIELKMANLKFMREKHRAKLLAVFADGYFTDKHTKRVLRENDCYGLPEEDVYFCLHQVSHRVNPTVSDLTYWFEHIRAKGISKVEEELAFQYCEAMKRWTVEKGEGCIYRAAGRNETTTLVSPGHFYSFISLVSDHVLGQLIERGVRRLIVSSNDNVMATVDPAILAYHVLHGRSVTSEIVPRLLDRGGAPIAVNGGVELCEDFCFPDRETLWKTPFFYPITSWIEIEPLLELCELTQTDVVEAAHHDREKQKRCREAVRRLAARLPVYAVLKTIREDMGNGVVYTFPAIQFERIFGDLLGLLDPAFLLVPKLLRHTQIKSVDHIYRVYIDRSLEVLKPQLSF
jgi:galactokinase/mevalonate kinase-like predicted kinase